MKNLQLILCILTIVMIGGSASAYNPLYPCECPVMENSGPNCDPGDPLDRNCGEMDFRVFYNNSTYIIGPTDYDGDPDHIGSPPIDNRFPISTTVGLTFYNPKLDGTDYDFINWDAECTGLDKQDTYWSYEHYLSDITGPGTLTLCCPGAPGPEASWTTPSTAGLYTIDSTINDEVGGIPPWSCTYSSQMWYNDAPESREDDVVVEEHWVNDAVCSDYLTYDGQHNIKIYYEIYPDTGWMPDKIELWFIQYGGGTGEARFDLTGNGLGQKSFTWSGHTESVEEPGKEGDTLVPMGSYMVYITMEYGPYGMHTLKKSLRGGGTRMIHLVPEPLNMTMADLNEADEIYPGRFINLNNDDDNNNGIPDYLDSYVAGEDDLVALTLDAASFLPSGASVYLRETGAPGTLKIWTDPAKGVGSEVDISGNGYAILNSSLPVTFYAEGYAGSTTVDPGGVMLAVCYLAGFGNSGGVNDEITTPIGEESACDIDLDVDSDNNNCIEPYGPDNSTQEDNIEENAPGRYIIVNNDDDDGDGIPDYFDGFNLDGSPSDDDVCAAEDDFVKMTFKENNVAGEPISLNVRYTSSDPDSATFTPPDQYQLPTGTEGIRIWRFTEVMGARDKSPMLQGGDFLKDETYVPPEKGILSSYYIEGIFPGEYTIAFEMEYEDGEDTVICEDTVTVSVLPAVMQAELKSITFTSDHGLLVDNNTDWTDTGTPYSQPEWVNGTATNNPISHTKNTKVTVDVRLEVEPPNLVFDLVGIGPNEYISFNKAGNTATGSEQTISMEATTELPDQVDTLTKDIYWFVKVSGFNDIILSNDTSGPHKLYVTYDIPIDSSVITEKRMAWVCEKAQGESDPEEIADDIHDALGDHDPPYDPFDVLFMPYGTGWQLMEGTTFGYCDHQSGLMIKAVNMLGLPAEIKYICASQDAGAGNCLNLEWKIEDGVKRWLLLDFTGGNTTWNAFVGCCFTAGKYYCVWDKHKADNDYDMLKNHLGARQFWVRTENDEVPGGLVWDVIEEDTYEECILP